jgi:hypothetical protein
MNKSPPTTQQTFVFVRKLSASATSADRLLAELVHMNGAEETVAASPAAE